MAHLRQCLPAHLLDLLERLASLPAVTVAEPPAGIVPSAQPKSGPAPIGEQLPWLGLIVPWLKPVGQTTLNPTDVASDGPALVTVIVYPWLSPSPATTLARPSVAVTPRSVVGSPST